MKKMNEIIIPWSQPEINEEELNHVIGSFKKDWLTMGPKVEKFEQSMAEYLKAPYAVAVTNGTVAIDIGLKILGVGHGDEVVVPAMSYIATASAVSYQHAVPVFVDIEPQSYNLDPARIEDALSPKTKGIIYIDYGGNPADYEGLKTVAEKHGLFLLQDAAQSLGALYKGSPAGAQTEISTMSFHMAKVMTTVEGGMIFTHNQDYAKEARIRRNQGESGKYLHSHLGTNARMTDISAAVGLAQFEKLEYMLQERRRVADIYNSFFENNIDIKIIKCSYPQSKHAYFFYPILVENRDNLVFELRGKGIDTRIAYPMPIYEQEVYSRNGLPCKAAPCPIAKEFASKVINLPIFPSLKDEQVAYIAEAVLRFAEK
jgi:perosamine synthetase